MEEKKTKEVVAFSGGLDTSTSPKKKVTKYMQLVPIQAVSAQNN